MTDELHFVEWKNQGTDRKVRIIHSDVQIIQVRLYFNCGNICGYH